MVLVTGLLVVGCGTPPADGEFRFTERTPKGTTIAAAERGTAPELSGTLVGGGDWRLTDARGRVVVLNFWYPSCAPCRVEAPEFDQVARANRDRGVDVVGIAVREPESAVAAFIEDSGLSYPGVYDPQGRSVQRFRNLRLAAFPFTIVVDRDGKVAGV